MKEDKFRIGLSIYEMIFALMLMYWAGLQPAPYEPPEGTARRMECCSDSCW